MSLELAIFSKQRISLEFQKANAASVLGTDNNKTTIDEIFFISNFSENMFSADVCNAAAFFGFFLNFSGFFPELNLSL